MSEAVHIVEPAMLRKLSGKRTAGAVRRWAQRQGIATKEGEEGPWTTLEAINKALGVGSANEPVYRPDDIA